MKEVGKDGFSKEYWDVNYSNPDEMDGIGNAENHAKYMKALFDLDFIDISSIVDLGFGLGHLLQATLKEFIPYRAMGIEPSKYPFELVLKRGISPVESTKLNLINTDLVSWCENPKFSKHFDLGICTSVFQYLSDEEVRAVIPILAKRVKYLYFSVPTDKELNRQIEDLEFKDEYAIRRSRSWYQRELKKSFTFVSTRVLESKEFFKEEDTFFTDLLFRF
ncbi:class I SAM-dependent methyltransferase [Halobacteriovorax sp. HLS]|uniref:class I SAM-dependent methyltransferase n=1 Tax=Halobacteriovorax sp. HLS TaxID=2234000 RepID=UPI000FDA4C66|nr:class I SAM-dependent methyltransferase [Halobacteriovorax sp. HLS]